MKKAIQNYSYWYTFIIWSCKTIIVERICEKFWEISCISSLYTKINGGFFPLEFNFDTFSLGDLLNWTLFILQLLLSSLIDTGVNARGSLVWKEADVPGKNPRVQASDIKPLSFTVIEQRWEASALTTTLFGLAIKYDKDLHFN